MPRRRAPDNLDRSPHWMDDAACAGVAHKDIEFFPLDDSNRASALGDARHLKQTFCVGCPVRLPCLTHALTHVERHGVWGGLDWEERAELLRQAERSRKAKEANAKAAEAAAAEAAA